MPVAKAAEEEDSDSGLDFEDAKTANQPQKTFRDLLSLKKVGYTERFGNADQFPK